jgi:hypothetical protein
MRMDTQDLQSMLSRIAVIRHASDLDLLLFFYRHSCALLTRERIAACLGYDRDRITKSLDRLIGTRFLACSQNSSHAARLYVLERGSVPDGVLPSFLQFAATRQGRQDVMRLLRSETNDAAVAGLYHQDRLSEEGM